MAERAFFSPTPVLEKARPGAGAGAGCCVGARNGAVAASCSVRDAKKGETFDVNRLFFAAGSPDAAMEPAVTRILNRLAWASATGIQNRIVHKRKTTWRQV